MLYVEYIDYYGREQRKQLCATFSDEYGELFLVVGRTLGNYEVDPPYEILWGKNCRVVQE